ncbi:MAG: hypothetical protein Q9163_003813 [Psora crenata]
MPGILPMKVIKVGTTANSRIAQACDRCRSKKIRCDGIAPCCSQCANVGFECKTSDKLSRRAFPRGYTESLEDRVRGLEGEVKELKDLLDAKDEKIDMLSRIHSNSPSLRRPSPTPPSSTTATPRDSSMEAQDMMQDTIRLHQSLIPKGDACYGSCITGTSSGRPFVDAFKARLEERGKPFPLFKAQTFFELEARDPPCLGTNTLSSSPQMPSRMASDQLINIFFQEWAPLFPVLHRPTVLTQYSNFVADPGYLQDQHAIAQLYLIFAIAAVSAEVSILQHRDFFPAPADPWQWNKHDASVFEPQWQAAFEPIAKEVTVPTLQCLLLAQLYCIAKRDYEGLLKYKAAAVKISRRLGLHQRQRRWSVGPLIIETRKRVFWTLYTVDCFSAALLGQPRSLSEEDIKCEYPHDVDDENVTGETVQPALPGESTRLSNALALFGGARILSGVLDKMYPTVASHQLSMQAVVSLSEELDTWLGSLPPHLRLHFVQDKPSADVVGSRSPFLSLTYHYVRTLIHRPLVSSSTGGRASTSIFALAQSSKHIIQIIQLLEDRRMSFSFCLNQNHVLTMAGFGLLFQTLDLDRKGKLIEDSQRLLCSVMSRLERDRARGAAEFKKIACAIISVERPPKTAPTVSKAATIHRKPNPAMPAPKSNSKSPGNFRASTYRNSSTPSPRVEEDLERQRLTSPTLSPSMLPGHSLNDGRSMVRSPASNPWHNTELKKEPNIISSLSSSEHINLPNLDYLDFNDGPVAPSNKASPPLTKSSSYVLGAATHCMNTSEQGGLEAAFPATDIFSYMSESPLGSFVWSPDIWNMATDLNDQPQAAQRRPSFPEEELMKREA